jgi:hypothetical protein
MAAQVILLIAYGIDVRPHRDPNVVVAEKALHAVSLASSMGGGLFDLVPWRRSPSLHLIPLVNISTIVIHMPSWFPGASFKREGRKLLPHVTAMIEEPYAVVQAALVRIVIFLPDICQTRDFNFAFGPGGRNGPEFCRRESDNAVE